MTVLSIESARAAYRLGKGLEDADLRELIEREETYLARLIGPLTGDLVQTFPGGGFATLRLRRTISAIDEITDYGSTVSPTVYTLDDSGQRIYAPGYWWTGPIVVTGPLADVEIIRGLVADLVKQRLIDTGHISESTPDYSYSNAIAPEVRRRQLIADALSTTAGIF